MKMISPIEVTEDILVSSTLVEDDAPAWSNTAAYVVGDVVIRAHALYECAADNTGTDPATGDDAVWIRLSATNKYRAFDGYLSDPAQASGNLSFAIRPGQIATGIALLGVSAGSVRLVVTSDTDGNVYDRTSLLIETANVFDLYSYFFAPILSQSEIVIDDLPPYGDATIEVQLLGPDIEVAQIVLGDVDVLGGAAFGASVSFKDYSTKDRDTFGRAIVVERDYADVVDFPFMLPTAHVSRVKRVIAERRTRPTLFYGNSMTTGFGTLVYGFPGQLHVTLKGPIWSDATLDVEGLT